MNALAAFPGSFATDEEWLAAGIALPSDRANYCVEDVQVSGPLTLWVRHKDGVAGLVRFEDSAFDNPVFSSFRDAEFFSRVYIDHGAVTWPGELDIAPDNMHRHLFAFGEWVLR